MDVTSEGGIEDALRHSGPTKMSQYHPVPSFLQWNAAPFDDSVFERSCARLIDKREEYGDEAVQAAVEKATRTAAVDTGALEGLYSVDRGFTRTVAYQTATWENEVSKKGPHVRSAIDDAIAAYEYVLDAATQKRAITEVWIRELHEVLCASQETFTVLTPVGPQEQPLPKGIYKNMPNNPTSIDSGNVHQYAPVADTPSEMARLVEQFRTPGFTAAHPVLQAAYAHYAYVCIHPFADGNGRVARALASVFLYRRPGVPLVIFADQRTRYLDALESADAGDIRPFVNFLEVCVIDAIEILIITVRPERPTANMSLAALSAYYASVEGEVDFDDAAELLSKLIEAEFDSQITNLPLPTQLTVRTFRGAVIMMPVPSGYRRASTATQFSVRLTSQAPALADLFFKVAPFVRSRDESLLAELVVETDLDIDRIEVALREIKPSITSTLHLKISSWVESWLEEGLSKLLAAATAANQGHS